MIKKLQKTSNKLLVLNPYYLLIQILYLHSKDYGYTNLLISMDYKPKIKINVIQKYLYLITKNVQTIIKLLEFWFVYFHQMKYILI